MRTAKEYIVWSANRDSEYECVRIRVVAEVTMYGEEYGKTISLFVEADKVEECGTAEIESLDGGLGIYEMMHVNENLREQIIELHNEIDEKERLIADLKKIISEAGIEIVFTPAEPLESKE